VFALIPNVLLNGRRIRLADGEGGIARLPIELAIARSLRFHPFRAPFLNLLDDFLEGVIFRQGEQGMYMILDAVNQDCGTVPFLEDALLVGIQTIGVFLWDRGYPVLGAVDKMNEVL